MQLVSDGPIKWWHNVLLCEFNVCIWFHKQGQSSILIKNLMTNFLFIIKLPNLIWMLHERQCNNYHILSPSREHPTSVAFLITPVHISPSPVTIPVCIETQHSLSSTKQNAGVPMVLVWCQYCTSLAQCQCVLMWHPWTFNAGIQRTTARINLTRSGGSHRANQQPLLV